MCVNGQPAGNSHIASQQYMCATNAVTDSDGAGNRKLDKAHATGRMDLMICAVMSAGVMNMPVEKPKNYQWFFV